MIGRLIVFEGTDGSGKSTQFRRLCDRLDSDGTEYRRIVFPQYDEPSSALIRMYLGGEFGSKPSDVNPYAASTFYAVDRYASYRKKWGAAYEAGELILADRYTTSNAVHQASKLPRAERKDFFLWLYDFEFGKLGLPKPDLVLYLDLPTEQSIRNLRRRETETHTTADIHEADTAYLAACRESALEAADVLGWTVVSCMRDGRLRTVEDIAEEIWQYTEPLLQQGNGT